MRSRPGRPTIRVRPGAGVPQTLRASPVPWRRPEYEDRSMGSSVLVVDDHEGFRTEARAVLEGDGFTVVGEAATAAAAIDAAAALQPAIVVLDVGLPDASGLDIVERIRGCSPSSLIVLVSGRQAREYGARIADARADAFVEKARLMPGSLPELLGHLRAG